MGCKSNKHEFIKDIVSRESRLAIKRSFIANPASALARTVGPAYISSLQTDSFVSSILVPSDAAHVTDTCSGQTIAFQGADVVMPADLLFELQECLRSFGQDTIAADQALFRDLQRAQFKPNQYVVVLSTNYFWTLMLCFCFILYFESSSSCYVFFFYRAGLVVGAFVSLFNEQHEPFIGEIVRLIRTGRDSDVFVGVRKFVNCDETVFGCECVRLSDHFTFVPIYAIIGFVNLQHRCSWKVSLPNVSCRLAIDAVRSTDKPKFDVIHHPDNCIYIVNKFVK